MSERLSHNQKDFLSQELFPATLSYHPNPLQTEEFISSLAKTEYFYKDDYLKEKEFLKIASGMDEIYQYLKEKREENEKNQGKR